MTSKVGGYQKALYWNRTLTGEVVGVFNHPQGKGLHILIAYDADENTDTTYPKGKVNRDNVMVRTFPKNQGGTVVDILNKGAQVSIYDTIRDADGVRWYKIGDNRYIHRDFVDLI